MRRAIKMEKTYSDINNREKDFSCRESRRERKRLLKREWHKQQRLLTQARNQLLSFSNHKEAN